LLLLLVIHLSDIFFLHYFSKHCTNYNLFRLWERLKNGKKTPKMYYKEKESS